MSRNWRLFLADMIESADRIIADTATITREDFDANDTVRDAVLLRLLTMGEAAKQVPDVLKARYPEVEWRKIAGFRDVIAHSYFRINQDGRVGHGPEPGAGVAGDAGQDRRRAAGRRRDMTRIRSISPWT